MIHHLKTETVSLLIDTSNGSPAILYWGRRLRESPRSNDTLGGLFEEPIPEGGLDVRTPVQVFPEHGSGYPGRPGLWGRRPDGSGWAPRFTASAGNNHDDTASDDTASDDTASKEHAPVHNIVCHVGQDVVAGLAITTTIELTTSGVVRIGATVTNTADTVYELDGALLTIAVPPEARESLALEGRWTNEFNIVRRPWESGSQAIENRRGRTSHDRTPFLAVGTTGFDETTGSVWGFHVGFSGNSALYADANDSRRSVSLGELLFPGEIVLAPGESYDTPFVYGSFSANGLGPMSRSFHSYLRARTNHPVTDRPVVLNTWEAVYFAHDLATLSALADRAAEVGVERFVLDDGWFGGRRNDRAGLGDWWVSPEVWPTGLTPLIEHVTGLGMQFGIWVEPEMVNPDSELYRAHPDWVLEDPAYEMVTGRHQLVLNLGLVKVRDYLFNHLDALLSDHNVSYVKWDMNRDLVHASNDRRAASHTQTLGVYELFDRITTAHPEVEFESCASGGARIDFKILDYTKRFWTSDSNDAHDRQNIQRGFSLLFPPELMGSHVGPTTSHTTMRTLTMSLRGITSLFGHFGTEWNLLKVTDAEFESLRTWIQRYKQHRTLLHTGDVYRIDIPHGYALAHGVVATDKTEALFAYVQMQAAPTLNPDRVRLPGLEPTTAYDVRIVAAPEHRFGPAKRQPSWTTDGIVATGDQLAHIGLHPPTLDPDAAILIHVSVNH